MFNIREGLKIEEENLPDRAFKNPIPKGVALGKTEKSTS